MTQLDETALLNIVRLSKRHVIHPVWKTVTFSKVVSLLSLPGRQLLDLWSDLFIANIDNHAAEFAILLFQTDTWSSRVQSEPP